MTYGIIKILPKELGTLESFCKFKITGNVRKFNNSGNNTKLPPFIIDVKLIKPKEDFVKLISEIHKMYEDNLNSTAIDAFHYSIKKDMQINTDNNTMIYLSGCFLVRCIDDYVKIHADMITIEDAKVDESLSGTIKTSSINGKNSVVLKPTMKLRWLIRHNTTYLQQCFIEENGNETWKDIPTIAE